MSHDQHPDNLGAAGRELLTHVPMVLTTTAGAGRIGSGARGLEPWESVEISSGIRVTAVPAEHGPPGAEKLSGPVIGFVISGADTRSVYVSGDCETVNCLQVA